MKTKKTQIQMNGKFIGSLFWVRRQISCANGMRFIFFSMIQDLYEYAMLETVRNNRETAKNQE